MSPNIIYNEYKSRYGKSTLSCTPWSWHYVNGFRSCCCSTGRAFKNQLSSTNTKVQTKYNFIFNFLFNFTLKYFRYNFLPDQLDILPGRYLQSTLVNLFACCVIRLKLKVPFFERSLSTSDNLRGQHWSYAKMLSEFLLSLDLKFNSAKNKTRSYGQFLPIFKQHATNVM